MTQEKLPHRKELCLQSESCCALTAQQLFLLRMKLSFLTGQLFGVINYAALTDHIYLDLSGIFQFSFDLLGNISCQQYHIGI